MAAAQIRRVVRRTPAARAAAALSRQKLFSRHARTAAPSRMPRHRSPRLRRIFSTQRGELMYVRIARFEGADDNWEERIEEVRSRMRGTSSEAAALDEVRGSIERVLMLVDREGRRVASVLFCDSEETLRALDEAMNR